MKKLVVLLIVSLFALIPGVSTALVIGDIDFDRFSITDYLDEAEEGKTSFVCPYPDEDIKIVQVIFSAYAVAGTNLVKVGMVRYIKNNELFVWRDTEDKLTGVKSIEGISYKRNIEIDPYFHEIIFNHLKSFVGKVPAPAPEKKLLEKPKMKIEEVSTPLSFL